MLGLRKTAAWRSVRRSKVAKCQAVAEERCHRIAGLRDPAGRSGAGHDQLGAALASAFVSRECPGHWSRHELREQHCDILKRLSRALAEVRRHGMGGITDEHR
jgi:hypothetical protein